MANFTKSLDIKAAQIADRIVRMCTSAGSGHPSSALSLVHIVTVLMYHKMRYDPLNPFDPGQDMLVLSEGHAVPVIYAAYADLGGAVGSDPGHLRPLKDADLDKLRELESLLDGHPNPAQGFGFLPMATGSLGQGLSMAAGLALGAKLNNSDQRIYCICGDGESREGQIAEALDFIIDFKLDNVVTIFNCNGQGQSQPVSAQQSPGALSKKLAAFGFDSHIIDGHDIDALLEHLSQPSQGVPLALCAKTTKGWGSSKLERGNWHGKTLPADHLDKAIAEYNDAINRLNEIPGKVVEPRPPKPTPAGRPAGRAGQKNPAQRRECAQRPG